MEIESTDHPIGYRRRRFQWPPAGPGEPFGVSGAKMVRSFAL